MQKGNLTLDIKKIDRVDLLNDSSSIQIDEIINIEGAVIVRNVFSEDFIQELKNNLQDCIDEDEKKFGRDYVFYGMVHALMTRKKCFRTVVEDELVTEVMRKVLGNGAIVHAFNSSSLPPQSSNFAGKIHVDSPRMVPGYITNMVLTIALDDFTKENGAMEIWPSSFDQKNPPAEEDFNNHMIRLDTVKAGDVILFNARCWHKGGMNTTQVWRHAIALTGCRPYMRQQFDFPKMFKKEDEALFSESFKQLMGYFVRTPQSIEQFLLPSDQRLYKGGQE